ncbi:MAG: SAM-dependent methyltransferase [Clostridiales bacterium]|nr:SAM-dependent methyltransferase [Clostridiales bacterium]
MDKLQDYLQEILEEGPARLIVSKPRDRSNPCPRIAVRRCRQGYQAERRVGSQVFHENLEQEALAGYLTCCLTADYRQLNAFTSAGERTISISKRGEPHLSRSKGTVTPAVLETEAHNREKRYLIREGQAIEPLVDMGIFTKEGRVAAPMQDKYRQINRFIEVIDDVVSRKKIASLKVVDFGCGKGYLTFLLYYYLVELRHIQVEMTGVDLKREVMEECQAAADRYGYDGLRFVCGDIRSYEPKEPPDMVVSLHACDTATDYVLYHAVRWGAQMIFSMPCCQHELNGQLESERFAILTRYGLLKENAASLFTDALRGHLLTASGYRVQMLDIVNPLNTPKNILIRAVKGPVSADSRRRAEAEAWALMEEFHLRPTLYTLLFPQEE